MVWVHMAYALNTAIESSPQVRSRDDMLANINSKAEVVVDARSAGRFVGSEPEPRAGLRGGHIPGAVLKEGTTNQPINQPANHSHWKDPQQLSHPCGYAKFSLRRLPQCALPHGTGSFRACRHDALQGSPGGALSVLFSGRGPGRAPAAGGQLRQRPHCLCAGTGGTSFHWETGEFVWRNSTHALQRCHPTSHHASVHAHRLPSTMAHGWSGAAGRTLLSPRMAIDQFIHDGRRAGIQRPREAAAVPQCPAKSCTSNAQPQRCATLSTPPHFLRSLVCSICIGICSGPPVQALFSSTPSTGI